MEGLVAEDMIDGMQKAVLVEGQARDVKRKVTLWYTVATGEQGLEHIMQPTPLVKRLASIQFYTIIPKPPS